MTAHRRAKGKVWTGLVLLLLGAGLVLVAPAAADDEASGNLTCEAVIGDLGLTDVVMAKDDGQRTAPYEGTAVNGDFVVTYRFVAAPEGAPEPYVVTFESEDLVFGVFVKQAAEKQDLSRSMVFPTGTRTGSVHVPDGEFSHVSFCTGTVPTTEPPVTEPPVTEPPVTVPPVTEPPVTEPPVTEPPETVPPVTEPPTTTTEVEGDEVVPTTEAPPTTGEAPTTEPPAVLGDTVVRELPYTGSGTAVLGVTGLAMLLLGSYLVVQSGRELRRQATRS